MHIRTLIPLVLFLLLAVLFWQSLSLNPLRLPSPLVGKAVPEFSARILGQTQVVHSRDLTHGKVTLLNVWATWCMSCLQEHEFLKTIADQIQVIGLNYKDEDPKALVWLAQFGNPYQLTLTDPHGKIGIQLGVYNTPETFLIDEQGMIRYRYVGILTEEIWNKEFVPILKGQERA